MSRSGGKLAPEVNRALFVKNLNYGARVAANAPLSSAHVLTGHR